MSIFEAIIDAGKVEAAAKETIQEWIETYLAEVERQSGRDPRALPLPRSYHTAPEFDIWPEDQLPAIVLVSPGLAEAPEKDGRGRVRAPWALGLAVVVSARDQAATNDLAKVYVAALRTLVLQRGSLGGFATETRWIDERYDDLPADENRSIAGGQAIFVVHVEAVANARGGPVTVPADPYAIPAPWPPVQTTIIATEREAVS